MRSNSSSALQMGNKWKPESVKALNLLSEAWLHWWRGRGADESLTRCSGMMWRCTGTGMWLNCENPANEQEKQDELLNHTFTVRHSGMSTQFPAWLLFLNSLSESSFLNTYAVHSEILSHHGSGRVFSAMGFRLWLVGIFRRSHKDFCCSLLAHNFHCGLSGMPDWRWIQPPVSLACKKQPHVEVNLRMDEPVYLQDQKLEAWLELDQTVSKCRLLGRGKKTLL